MGTLWVVLGTVAPWGVVGSVYLSVCAARAVWVHLLSVCVPVWPRVNCLNDTAVYGVYASCLYACVVVWFHHCYHYNCIFSMPLCMNPHRLDANLTEKKRPAQMQLMPVLRGSAKGIVRNTGFATPDAGSNPPNAPVKSHPSFQLSLMPTCTNP